MIRLVFRPAAAGDVEDGFQWYEDQRLGLGDEFLEEVERVVACMHASRDPVRWSLRG